LERKWAAGVGLENPNPAPTGPAAQQPLSTPDDLAAQYHTLKQQQQQTTGVGAEISPHYQPHTLLTHPPSPADVTLELLLASEAHQGHATSLWNPANARYIHGIRQGIHVISLEQTAAHLRRAAKVG
jgi:small subunit ribosomal protein S2